MATSEPIGTSALPYYLQRIRTFIESSKKTISFPGISPELKEVLIVITENTDHLNGDQFSDNVKVEAAKLIATKEAHVDINLKHEFRGENILMYKKVETTTCKTLEPLRKPSILTKPTFEPADVVTPTFKTSCLNSMTKFVKDDTALIMHFPDMTSAQAEFAMNIVLPGIKGKTEQMDIGFGYRSMYAPLWESMRLMGLKYNFSIGFKDPSNTNGKMKHVVFAKTTKEPTNEKLTVDAVAKLDKSSISRISTSALTISKTATMSLVSSKSLSTLKQDPKISQPKDTKESPPENPKIAPPIDPNISTSKDLKISTPKDANISPPVEPKISSTKDLKISPTVDPNITPKDPKISTTKDLKISPPVDPKISATKDSKISPTVAPNIPRKDQNQVDIKPTKMHHLVHKLKIKMQQNSISPQFIHISLQRISYFLLKEEEASIVFEQISQNQLYFLENVAQISKDDMTYMLFTSECQRYLGDIKYCLKNKAQYKIKFSGRPKQILKDLIFEKLAVFPTTNEKNKHKSLKNTANKVNKGLESSDQPGNEWNKGLESSDKPLNERNKVLESSDKPVNEWNKGLESSDKPVNEGNKVLESSNKLANGGHGPSAKPMEDKENEENSKLTQEEQDSVARCKAIKEQVEQTSGLDYITNCLEDISDFLSDNNTDRGLIFQATSDQAVFLKYVHNMSKTEVVYRLFSKKCRRLLSSIRRNAQNFRMHCVWREEENEQYTTVKIIKKPLESEEGKATPSNGRRRKKIKAGNSTEMGAESNGSKIHSQLMEGLSQPVQSEKAMKMMQSMGWTGGALGLRGDGITEPIMPLVESLVAKRSGLGAEKPKPKPPKVKSLKPQLKATPLAHEATPHCKPTLMLMPHSPQIMPEKMVRLYKDYHSVALESILELMTSDMKSIQLVDINTIKHSKVLNYVKHVVLNFNIRKVIGLEDEYLKFLVAEVLEAMASQPDLIIHLESENKNIWLQKISIASSNENYTPKNSKNPVTVQDPNNTPLAAQVNNNISNNTSANATAITTKNIPNVTDNKKENMPAYKTDNKMDNVQDDNEITTYLMIDNDKMINIPDHTGDVPTSSQLNNLQIDFKQNNYFKSYADISKTNDIKNPIIKKEDNCPIILNNSDNMTVIDTEKEDLLLSTNVKTETNKPEDKVAIDNSSEISKPEMSPELEDTIDALDIGTSKEKIKLEKDLLDSAHNQDNSNLRKRLSSVASLNEDSSDIKKFKLTTEFKKLSILPKDYPQTKMDNEKAQEIQTSILKAIDNTNGKLPLLCCQGIQNGGLVYSCQDEKGVNIIEDLIRIIDNLTIVYEFEEKPVVSHKMAFKLNSFVEEDVYIIFNRLQVYNSGLDVTKWKFIRKEQHSDYIVIYIEINDESFGYVRDANFILNAGNDCAKFTIIWD